MRPILLPLVLGSLLLSTTTSGEIQLEIVGAPEQVYSYEPVPVVYEARNAGSVGVAIPAEGCGGLGGYLEVGPAGESLQVPFLVNDCVPDRLVWLEPGERWLFLQDVTPGEEGLFEIQAVLRSRATCTGRPAGPHRKLITGDAGKPYECWEGEVRSQRIAVTVDKPTTAEDRSAAEFLMHERPNWKSNWKRQLASMYRELFERFPGSHYTYAAARAGADFPAMVNVVILQPDNPLNPWVAGAMAVQLAHRSEPCAPAHTERFADSPGLAERFERAIAAYPPPKPLRDYLRQQAMVHATEECPEPKRSTVP